MSSVSAKRTRLNIYVRGHLIQKSLSERTHTRTPDRLLYLDHYVIQSVARAHDRRSRDTVTWLQRCWLSWRAARATSILRVDRSSVTRHIH